MLHWFAKKGESVRILHYDNATPHTAKIIEQNLLYLKFTRLPQPPFSPDIAPTDFYLNGYLKAKLENLEFGNFGELHSAVDQILDEITPTTLKSVFDRWITKLEQVVSSNGDYC